jgi:hypothetical protein
MGKSLSTLEHCEIIDRDLLEIQKSLDMKSRIPRAIERHKKIFEETGLSTLDYIYIPLKELYELQESIDKYLNYHINGYNGLAYRLTKFKNRRKSYWYRKDSAKLAEYIIKCVEMLQILKTFQNH